MNTSGKLCPICKNENEETAKVCIYCGTWLEENQTKLVAKPDKLDASKNISASQAYLFIDIKAIPKDGIGIHVAGETKPIYVHVSKEITIGRLKETDSKPEDFLDLSGMHAGIMGVSRRHAMIRRTGSGFEVLDLLSRNGSWLNAERLIPNKAYPFASGSQLRIGNMRLLIMYHSTSPA